jgi:hypothetical protein
MSQGNFFPLLHSPVAKSQYTEFMVLVLKIADFLKRNYFEKQQFLATIVIFTCQQYIGGILSRLVLVIAHG